MVFATQVYRYTLALLVFVPLSVLGQNRPADTTDRARAERELLVLLEKHCSACHGTLANRVVPEFIVLDLDGLTKSGDLVPGDPPQSRIWQRVFRGEMPPPHLMAFPASQKSELKRRIEALKPTPTPGERRTITEEVRNHPRLKILYELANSTPAILRALDAPGPFTVLAPVDNGYLPQQLEQLRSSEVATSAFLLQHGILDKLTASALENSRNATSVFGYDVSITRDPDDGQLRIGDKGPSVLEKDIICSNGILHIIDRPLGNTRSPSRGQKPPVTPCGVQMVQIDGDRLLMGTPGGGMESPQRDVQVLPFLIGETEVTWHEYLYVMGDLPVDTIWLPDVPPGAMPVYDVNWLQAAEFCNRCSQMERLTPYYQIVGEGTDAAISVKRPRGNGYRLPTEAEWEFACRANNKGDYCCPLPNLPDFAVFNAGGPQIAGEKQPNAFGLYDMHGNVAEWCDDWYDKYQPAPAGQVLTDPRVLAPGSLLRKAYRGGSFIRSAESLRSAWRGSASIIFRTTGIGFRIARSP